MLANAARSKLRVFSLGEAMAAIGTARGRLRLLAGQLIALAFLFHALSPTEAATGPEKSKLVVMLYPDNSDGSPGNLLADRSIRAVFSTESTERIEVYNEYLDVSRSPDPEHAKLQAEYLRRKYAGRKVDLVMAGLSSALDFALAHRQTIFPGVPLVFLAVDEREVRLRKLPDDVTGIPIKMDLRATLDLALRLHPATRHVFVIVGKAKFDSFWEGRARDTFHDYGKGVEFVYLSGLQMADLLKRVSRLPDRSIIYYVHIFQDGTGKVFVPADALERVAAVANAPIYSHVDSYIGRGVVGGRVISFEKEARAAARLGLRILQGQRPEQLGIQPVSDNSFMFDAQQMRRWGIDETSVPPGSDIRFREPNAWERYKWPLIGIVSLCLVEAFLICTLLVQRSGRRRALSRLRESESRFRLMTDTAPVMVWMSGPDKLCTYFNKPWLKFTGRPLEHELGNGWSEGVHPEDLQRCLDTYCLAFDTRTSFRMEYRLRRADAEYRWIVDAGVPRFKPDGTFEGYIGSCMDITQEKQVQDAMREKQRELRMLTGRLLQAQESERRRIARELHDDLNQSLALLSVEMDMLSQAQTDSAAQPGELLQQLSGRVKQLSSYVHGLSHQLHPSKLEKLGLVAAIRGLCAEFSHGHHLPIEFSHRDVPDTIPEASALCLYRIVQEAVGNIIKHSGARKGRVDLSGGPDAIHLRITDDGKGFDTEQAAANGGLGLVSIRERLRLTGGEVTIDSKPSGGTRICLYVPLPATEKAAESFVVEAAVLR